ncbi:MAG: hypothetical protein IJ075_04450, partial [Lachnospiraceae bacterium]|nr:hypothetical protein [Lachnospiraceae bacterium]
RLAKLKAYMGYFRDYKKYLPVYEESQGIFFKGRKKAYQDEHRRELNLLHMAKRKLEKIDALSDLKTMEAMCRKDLERTEQKIADRLSQLGKERLEDEVRYLKIIRKAVDYCSNMGGMVSGEGTGADEMTLTERGKQDNKEVHKRSFSDALADKAAEADRINAGRTYGRNNPIHGRDER